MLMFYEVSVYFSFDFQNMDNLNIYKNVNSNMLSLLDTLYNKKFIITKDKAKSKNLNCSKTKKAR